MFKSKLIRFAIANSAFSYEKQYQYGTNNNSKCNVLENSCVHPISTNTLKHM